MLDIYLAPTRAFDRLKEKPSWLLPLAIGLVAALAVTAISSQFFDWEAQKEKAVEEMQKRNMTEEQVNQALERMEGFYSSPVMRTGAPLVGALVTHLVAAFFLALVTNLALPLLGATGSYLRTLAVICTAGLVAVPAAIVRGALILVQRTAEVSTSLGIAFPGLKSGFPAVIVNRIELFAIWQLILVGLGLKVVYDIKGSRTYWLVSAIWLLITVVLGLLAALSGR